MAIEQKKADFALKLCETAIANRARAEKIENALKNGTIRELINNAEKFENGIKEIESGKIHLTEYCTFESGKMIGTCALGTTCHISTNCAFNIDMAVNAVMAAIENDDDDALTTALNMVCLHCYSAQGNMYDFDVMHLIVNHNRLSTEFISDDELNAIAKRAVKIATSGHTVSKKYKDGTKVTEFYPATYEVRIQHKGDVENVIEVRNYGRLAELIKGINSNVSVTCWTKFPDIYEKAFSMFPEIDFSCMRYGVSAYATDENGVNEVKRLKAKHSWLNFGFVVYHRDGKTYTDAENENYVNGRFTGICEGYTCAACKCDRGSCGKCGICYGKRGDEFKIVFELIR